MRVRATASGNQHSNAIGQVELSCTPAGLSIGLFGVGPYTEGYAVGALASGTRFTIPYQNIVSARAYEDQLQLQFDSPTFPHDRLTLTRFSAGPGVPPEELRRRRLILHLGALSFSALASLAAILLAPSLSRSELSFSALSYGLSAGAIVLALGYALDHAFFVKPPHEQSTRQAFVSELSVFVPSLVSSETSFAETSPPARFEFARLIPRTAAMVGIVIAATVMTALVTGQHLFMQRSVTASLAETAVTQPERLAPTAPPAPPEPRVVPTEPNPIPTPGDVDVTGQSQEVEGSSAKIERRCMCDRADSSLWKTPIPRLSALLIERRAIPTKTHMRTQLQIAIVNNSDTPIDEITLHVQFSETRGKETRPTKERPLYFEGPLRPGQAIKWSTEARGDDYELLVPDLGQLGPNGDGAAPAEAFVELLEANHRPVRLHAARILSYLGDARAREAALHLKDAMRAAEGPYLRRVLMATADVRVCDIELRQGGSSSLGVCVYNATDRQQADLGVQLNLLSGSLDVSQPLSDPPELLSSTKWSIDGQFPAQSGKYVRVLIPTELVDASNQDLEVLADRYDLLD